MAPSLLDTSTGNDFNDQSTFPQSGSVTLRPGFYVPTVAFFEAQTEDIDVETTKKHAIRLAEAGVTGLVTHGSNGEAVHLSHHERMLINKATREALDSAGRTDMPLIVGCGAQSTREVVELCKEAHGSGGQFALILPPSYYGGLLSKDLIARFFQDVADASPIPVIIYNYPGACSGLDLDSDTITTLSKHKNIVGVKLTCGNTGKLVRLVADASTPFLIMGGSADFTLQTAAVGGHGIIGGLANVFPKSCLRIQQLAASGKQSEAQKLQRIVAKGDWVAIKGGFVSVKLALSSFHGYGGLPRRPTALPAKADCDKIIDDFSDIWALEKSL